MADAERQPLPEDIRAGYQRAVRTTAAQYERSICLLGLILAGLASVSLLSAQFRGVAIPVGVVYLAMGLMAWYGATFWALGAGRYRPWFRFVSVAVESSFPTAVFLIDAMEIGPAFALGAAAPPLYPLAVIISVLRLDWRMPLVSGVIGCVQQFLAITLVIAPAIPLERHAELGLQGFSTAAKCLSVAVAGVFGAIACRGLQRLFLRVESGAAERQRIRSLFSMHVSEAVMETLLADRVPEGGELRDVTVCFTDIRSFTRFCETRSPGEIVTFLNRYFERMCAIAERHGGVVNKFMGDGMLVIFGAPYPLADDARAAVAAATEMLEEAARMREAGEFPDLQIGVGLHRGQAVVGAIGSTQRREYTVIGDIVNAAARVQALTKEYGRPLLLTSAVKEKLGEFPLEALGQTRVRGRDGELSLFTPEASAQRERT